MSKAAFFSSDSCTIIFFILESSCLAYWGSVLNLDMADAVPQSARLPYVLARRDCYWLGSHPISSSVQYIFEMLHIKRHMYKEFFTTFCKGKHALFSEVSRDESFSCRACQQLWWLQVSEFQLFRGPQVKSVMKRNARDNNFAYRTSGYDIDKTYRQ